ncbi:hypothetical protein GUITHDRAFT_145428 [Guillardia theta CCMP2712]|uniref:Fido domain-containing protein n=1 Tax=Guillardia theta (strain CCMP2712) TaxID=905079 RepID=L1IL00_GUITC|nr:hypothetical protein GUITHDRAFT_145428 [Guillardia theta CCMP2712]EKX36933.1 hypothetical protein GUITHDRAFT_145428 [Guillardia theta CCMP2712]|eukprot:XP_005823913.1 hypothetical protein GUITHDRAFT_145428 [Guillardia theta CCMP2712]
MYSPAHMLGGGSNSGHFSGGNIGGFARNAPHERWGHAAVSISETKMLVLGGVANAVTTDCYLLDTENLTWSLVQTTGSPAVPTWKHSAVRINGVVYLYGGRSGSKFISEVHALNLDGLSWRKIEAKGKIPPGRSHHAAVVTKEGKMLVFGGQVSKKRYDNALWLFDIEKGEWTQPNSVGSIPRGRAGHTLTAIWTAANGGDSYIMFGGHELFMLSSDKMCWIKPACGGAPPAPTSGHVAVAIGSSLAIFGGYCYTRGCSEHSGVVVGSSMFVFGGTRESGEATRELLVLDLSKVKELQESELSSTRRQADGSHGFLSGGHNSSRGSQGGGAGAGGWGFSSGGNISTSGADASNGDMARLLAKIHRMEDELIMERNSRMQVQELLYTERGLRRQEAVQIAEMEVRLKHLCGMELEDLTSEQVEDLITTIKRNLSAVQDHLSSRHNNVTIFLSLSPTSPFQLLHRILALPPDPDQPCPQITFRIQQLTVGSISANEYANWLLMRLTASEAQVNQITTSMSKMGEESGNGQQNFSRGVSGEDVQDMSEFIEELLLADGLKPILTNFIFSLDSQNHKTALLVFGALIPQMQTCTSSARLQEGEDESNFVSQLQQSADEIQFALKFLVSINVEPVQGECWSYLKALGEKSRERNRGREIEGEKSRERNRGREIEGEKSRETSSYERRLAKESVGSSPAGQIPFFSQLESPAMQMIVDWLKNTISEYERYVQRHGAAFLPDVSTAGDASPPLLFEAEIWETLGRLSGGTGSGSTRLATTYYTRTSYSTARTSYSSTRPGAPAGLSTAYRTATSYGYATSSQFPPSALSGAIKSVQPSMPSAPAAAPAAAPADNPPAKSDAKEVAAKIAELQLKRKDWPKTIDTKEVKQIHRCLTLDVNLSGEYRKEIVTGTGNHISAYRCFVPFEEVERLMDFLFDYANSHPACSSNQALRAYLVYSVLVYFIHPFKDGNGRTGRILANCILKAAGFPALITHHDKVLSFDAFFWRVKLRSGSTRAAGAE